MNDDPLMRRLAQVQREELDAEQASLDERWDRLSAGELSPEEEAELRALAETSEDARQAYEAFRPLGPEFQAQVVRAIQAQSQAPEARRGGGPEPGKLSGQRRPLPRRASRLAGWSAVAAAAALVLFLRVPDTQPPLPGYTLELSGGIQEKRGGQPGPPSTVVRCGNQPGPPQVFMLCEDQTGLTRVFPLGSQFELVLRPQTAVSGPIAVRYFLGRGTALHHWPAPDEITTDGSVRIAGTVGPEIAIPSGKWTLWVVVGRPGTLPDAAELRSCLSRPPSKKPEWLILKIRLKTD